MSHWLTGMTEPTLCQFTEGTVACACPWKYQQCTKEYDFFTVSKELFIEVVLLIVEILGSTEKGKEAHTQTSPRPRFTT